MAKNLANQFFSIDLAMIKPGETLAFDIFLYLPLNDHMILLRGQGDLVDTALLQRFQKRGIRQVYIRNEDHVAYRTYLAGTGRAENIAAEPGAAGSAENPVIPIRPDLEHHLPVDDVDLPTPRPEADPSKALEGYSPEYGVKPVQAGHGGMAFPTIEAGEFETAGATDAGATGEETALASGEAPDMDSTAPGARRSAEDRFAVGELEQSLFEKTEEEAARAAAAAETSDAGGVEMSAEGPAASGRGRVREVSDPFGFSDEEGPSEQAGALPDAAESAEVAFETEQPGAGRTRRRLETPELDAETEPSPFDAPASGREEAGDVDFSAAGPGSRRAENPSQPDLGWAESEEGPESYLKHKDARLHPVDEEGMGAPSPGEKRSRRYHAELMRDGGDMSELYGRTIVEGGATGAEPAAADENFDPNATPVGGGKHEFPDIFGEGGAQEEGELQRSAEDVFQKQSEEDISASGPAARKRPLRADTDIFGEEGESEPDAAGGRIPVDEEPGMGAEPPAARKRSLSDVSGLEDAGDEELPFPGAADEGQGAGADAELEALPPGSRRGTLGDVSNIFGEEGSEDTDRAPGELAPGDDPSLDAEGPAARQGHAMDAGDIFGDMDESGLPTGASQGGPGGTGDVDLGAEPPDRQFRPGEPDIFSEEEAAPDAAAAEAAKAAAQVEEEMDPGPARRMLSLLLSGNREIQDGAHRTGLALVGKLLEGAGTGREDYMRIVANANVEHATSVAIYAVLLAASSGMTNKNRLRDLAAASLLHDLGLTQIPLKIVNTTMLNRTPRQARHYEEHVRYGVQILYEMGNVPNEVVMRLIQEHHENYDGSGYPKKISGEDIDQLSQFLAFADLVDVVARGRFDGVTREFGAAVEKARQIEVQGGRPRQFSAEVLKKILGCVAEARVQAA